MHLFALTVNLIPIKGESPQHFCNEQTYYFTNGHYDSEKGFWPFVKYNQTFHGYGCRDENTGIIGDKEVFNGAFYNYNIGAFIVYIAIGLGIVFIPILWRKPTGEQTTLKQSS